LTTEEITVTSLGPMRVASVRVISKSPERTAWEKIKAWAEPKGLLDDANAHPVYGFDNPLPCKDGDEYGYEFWIAVGPEIQPEGDVEIKDFAGGLYAVVSCEVKGEPEKTIPKAWIKLVDWVKTSRYNLATHQHLEKHCNPCVSMDELVLDLYCPISEP
jgi:DNA gyrase inhibitor GyrI